MTVTKEFLNKLEPYLDRDDFKIITYNPSDEAVVTEPVKLQKILVYSKTDPDRVVTIIVNGHIALDYKHINQLIFLLP